MVESIKKAKKIFIIISVIGILFALNTSVSAATSDAEYYLSFINADKDLYGEKYAPAQKLSSGEIQYATGEVSINEVDVSLPGKSGLDLNIHRIYSSQEPKHEIEHAYSTSKYNIYYKKAYYYTVMDGSGREILVAFDSENEMVDSFYSTESKLSVSLSEDEYGTEYKNYSSLKASTGTVLLERNKNEYMEEICKAATRVVLRDSKREGNIYLTENKAWKIAMPYVYRIGTDVKSSRKMHYYRFGNEKGEVYTLKFCVITDEDFGDPVGTIYSEVIYSRDHSISVVKNESEMTHTLKLTDNEGRIYEFNLGNVISTPTNKITDVTITDRYGNCLTYSNNEITDSYGRKLRVSSSGIEILNGTEYKPLVQYDIEKIYDQERDPQGLLDIFTKTQITVSKNTSLLTDAEDSFDETIYVMQLKETDSPTANSEASFVSLLQEVIYPDGQKYVYTYEDENGEEKEPANYYNDTYVYTVPRVKSKSEQIKIDETYTEKNSSSFSYTTYTPTTVLANATKVNEKIKVNGTTHKNITYKFDFADRLLNKSENKDSDVLLTQYMYEQPGAFKELNDIDKSDYIDFRQTPVNGIVVLENDIVTDVSYYDYTNDRKLKLTQRGLQRETYVYDETYGFVLESTKSTDDGKQLHTVNTKTEDGKSIAQTQVFEVVDGEEILKRTISYTYNTDGTVSSETTALGGTTSYSYDYSLFSNETTGKHKVTASVVTNDASGATRTETSSTEYDLLGNVKKITDGNGNSTEYTYDLMGRIVKEKYADGSERSVGYDTVNKTVTITEPNGKKVTNEYNHNGNLLKTYLPDENNKMLSMNTYDNLERKTKSTVYTDEQNTVSEEYEYDFLDRVVKKTDLQNSTVIETTNYSITNSVETVTLSASYSDSETVELNGEYAYALVIAKPTSSYDVSYDPYIKTIVDGVEIDCIYGYFNDVNFAAYDLNGANQVEFKRRMPGTAYILLVKKENIGTGSSIGTKTVTTTFTGDSSFVRPKEVTKYDHSGAVIYTELRDNTTDEVLSRDEYEYDFSGNITEYRNSKVTLDGVGEYTARTEYNFLGKPTKEINAAGDFKTYTYDELGRLLTATDETGVTTTFTYDALGREIVSESDISETEKTRTEKYYDSNGNVVKERIKNNDLSSSGTFKEVVYEYDSMNRLTAVKNDASIYSGTGKSYNGAINYTQYKYDAMGNVLMVTDGTTQKLNLSEEIPYYINVTWYEYDRFGNVTKETNAARNSQTAAYNLIGLPTSTTDRKGVTTTYTYNAYGSPLTVSTAGMDTITYTYNVNNILLRAEQGNDVITYEYDKLGRLTKETENGIVKTYQTDKVGNITYAEIAGVGTTYTYDNLNRMTGATFEGGSASYTYDDAGRLTGETKGGITTTYTYNPAGWLSSKTNTEGTETDTYSLTYYADGNIRTKTENTVATTYVYDGRGQLIRENDIIYSYDLRGNRSEKVDGEVETVYTYSEDNTLLGEERTDGVVKFYGYDQNGNMTSWTLYQETEDENGSWQVETVDSIRMTYDPLNRMSGYQANGVNATYTYGIDNMRNSKTVNGVTTNYIWDGGNIVAEADGNNAVTNRYFRGVGLIASITGDNVSYYQTNNHGDVSKWGTVDYSYDAFGNETTTSIGTNPFRYNGEYFDEETGFIYLRNRYYNPINGRFTTEDPYWNPQNMIYGDEQYGSDEIRIPSTDSIIQANNLYVYCGNNSINYEDPTGEGWREICKSSIDGMITGAIGGGVTGAISGGTVTVGIFTVPASLGGTILGGIGGLFTGLAQGILDELW